MLLFLLITLLYGSNSLPLPFFANFERNINTTKDMTVLGEITPKSDSSGRGDDNIKTTKGMNVLAEIKSNPQKFISEVQNLDPAALRHIISLLEDLLEKSNAREAELDTDLEYKKAALSDADGNVVDAEDVLDGANQAVTDAETVVGEKQVLLTDAKGAVTGAQAVVAEKQGDATSAESDLAAKKEVHKEKKAEKEAAEKAHNDEVPDLNDEQQVLTDVIAMLEDLHGKQGSQLKYWAVGPIASTDVSDDSCGSDGVLAMPKTREEQQNVLNVLPSLPSGGAYSGVYVWLGGKFDEISSSWKWNDGSPIGLPGTGETNWDNGQGQPGNGAREIYLGLNRESGLWHDFHGEGAEINPGQIALCQGPTTPTPVPQALFEGLEFDQCGSSGYTIIKTGAGSGIIVRGTGPTLDECKQQYGIESSIQQLENVVGDGIQQWRVPYKGLYSIECWGAGGATSVISSDDGGRGVRISASYNLNEGDNLFLLVGAAPESQAGCEYACGGGGGTFVMKGTSYEDATPVIVAGGGGGAGDSGGHGKDASFETSGSNGHPGYGYGQDGYGSPSNSNGGWGSSGAGYRGNGNGDNSYNGGNDNLAYSFWNGGRGSSGYLEAKSCQGQFGGFGGGGGGACNGGGGGGGYSGGGQGGGGGGSYTGNGDDRSEIGYNSGNGKIIITFLA